MLAKDPDQRPATCEEVVARLDTVEDWNMTAAAPSLGASESLTHAEKRLVSVVVIAPPIVTNSHVTQETVEDQPPGAHDRNAPGKLLESIRRVARSFGAKVEEIGQGTFVTLLVGTGPATDQVANAARCALRMQWLLPDHPLVLLTKRGENTQRIPIGDVFEHAASMLQKIEVSEQEATIAIDEVTQALLDVRFDVRHESGRVVLRGERDVGVQARTLLGKPSPFVGRDRELRHLLDLVHDALEESWSSAVLVTGEAGIGKSRLRVEFVHRVQNTLPQVITAIGRGDSVSAGSAFSLVASSFRSTLGVALDEPVESRRSKLSAMVSRYFSGDDLWRVAGFLGEMIGIPLADENDPRVRAARQNPAIMADRIQAAYVDLIRAAVASNPVLLVLEDLQWGDGPSIKLIDAALRELSDKPFLVVAFARPEVHEVFPNVWASRNVHTIPLAGLTRRSAETLVKTMLGETTQSRTIADIVERSGGNAFYLEELIRAVNDGRGDSLPETVLGMVEARIAALDSDARRLLRAASVFGETFWERALDEVLHGDATTKLTTHLEHLCRAELISRRGSSRFLGEHEYGFRHALVREAAYAMLTDNDRSVGHDRAGEWLIRAGEQDSMVLAGHFERGTAPMKAAIHYAKAAEQAMCGADLETAIKRAERGVACGAEGDALVALRYVISASCTLTAEYTKAYENSQLLLANPALHGLGRARAIGYSITSAIVLGKVEVFGGLIAEILALEPGPEAVAIVAHALYMAVITLLLAGHGGGTPPLLLRLDELAAQYPNDLLTVAWQHTARMHSTRETDYDPWQAREHNRTSVTLFEHVGARQNLAIYNAHLGLSHMSLAAFGEAEKMFDAVLATSDAGNLARMYATYYKTALCLETGRHDEALALSTGLAKDALQATDYLLLWCAQLATAQVLTAHDKLDDANAILDGLGETNAFLPFLKARLLSLRSEIRRRQGRHQEAVQAAEDSVAVGRAGPRYNYGEDPYSLRHALALHAAGDLDNARRVIREGRDDLLGCAAKIPDEAVRQAYLEKIDWHARVLQLAREWSTD